MQTRFVGEELVGYTDKMEGEIENYNNVIIPNLQKERDLHKSAYDVEFEDVESVVDKVFPESVNKFEIIKMLHRVTPSKKVKYLKSLRSYTCYRFLTLPIRFGKNMI